MSVNELKEQIRVLKKRIPQLHQFGYEEEAKQKEDVLQALEETLKRREFDLSQIELKHLAEKAAKEKEETEKEKPKRKRRTRKKKVVTEEAPE